jgi:addiction module HigA family antidote
MMARRTELLDPIHPGEILLEEFMRPLGISINALARYLRVPPNRISAIVNGKRGITADTALRLSRYFSNSAEFWLNLQASYDLRVARRQASPAIDREVIPRKAA